MKIHITMSPSETYRTIEADLEDLNVTEQEWETMNDTQREENINSFLADLPEQPYWCLDKYTER